VGPPRGHQSEEGNSGGGTLREVIGQKKNATIRGDKLAKKRWYRGGKIMGKGSKMTLKGVGGATGGEGKKQGNNILRSRKRPRLWNGGRRAKKRATGGADASWRGGGRTVPPTRLGGTVKGSVNEEKPSRRGEGPSRLKPMGHLGGKGTSILQKKSLTRPLSEKKSSGIAIVQKGSQGHGKGQESL